MPLNKETKQNEAKHIWSGRMIAWLRNVNKIPQIRPNLKMQKLCVFVDLNL